MDEKFESRPKFDRELSYKQLDQEDYDPRVSISYENQINEICLECQSNEEYWNVKKYTYKLIEIIACILTLLISSVSLILSLVYFSAYRNLFKYLKQIKLIKTNLFILMPFFYISIECVSFLLDLIKIVCSYKIFKVFSYEKIEKNSMERKNTRTEDYLLIYSQNNKTIQTIQYLKLRVKIRRQFKAMLKSLIGFEFFINFYYCIFVILPKILTASYVQINLLNSIKNQTVPFEQNVFKNFSIQLNCCLQNEIDCEPKLDCLNDKIDAYFDSIIILFYLTATFKFVIQTLLVSNFKLVLADMIIEYKMQAEEVLNKRYEKCKNYLFNKNVQERIEQNEKSLADKLENLSTDMVKKNDTNTNKSNNNNRKTNNFDMATVVYQSLQQGENMNNDTT